MHNKQKLLQYIIFCILIVLLCSCSAPLYDLPNYSQAEEEEKFFFNTAETFTFEPSDDKTIELQNDLVKNRIYFHAYENELYFIDDMAFCSFDETTGTFKHICKDPLCSHNTSECPYYRHATDGIYFNNNYVYFRQWYSDYDFSDNTRIDIHRFVRVNLDTNEIEVIRDLSNETLNYLLASELYTVKYHYYFDVEKDEDTGDFLIALMLQNLETKESKLIENLGNYSYQFIDYVEDMVYWSDARKFTVFRSSNYDLSEPEVVFKLDDYIICPIYSNGEIIFRTAPENGGVLYSYDLESKTKKKLTELDNDNFVVTDKYVYYTGEVKRYEFGIDERTNEIISLSDSVIWRVNRETLEKEKIFCLSDIAPNCAIDYYYPSGNYIYAYFSYYDSESTSIQDSRILRKLLRVNVNTGELYLIDTPVYN